MSKSSDWIETKDEFARSWRKVMAELDTSCLDKVGKRTKIMIGERGGGLLCQEPQDKMPHMKHVLREFYADKPGAWCQREVFLIDLAVLDLLGASWGDACKTGKWKTLAFIEHENNFRGLVPTVRKLLDYRSDVLRVVIGYSDDPLRDSKSKAWEEMWNSTDGAPLDSIVLVIGEENKSGVFVWYLFHFVDKKLELLRKTV